MHLALKSGPCSLHTNYTFDKLPIVLVKLITYTISKSMINISYKNCIFYTLDRYSIKIGKYVTFKIKMA
jgi:hypothetical protein